MPVLLLCPLIPLVITLFVRQFHWFRKGILLYVRLFDKLRSYLLLYIARLLTELDFLFRSARNWVNIERLYRRMYVSFLFMWNKDCQTTCLHTIKRTSRCVEILYININFRNTLLYFRIFALLSIKCCLLCSNYGMFTMYWITTFLKYTSLYIKFSFKSIPGFYKRCIAFHWNINNIFQQPRIAGERVFFKCSIGSQKGIYKIYFWKKACSKINIFRPRCARNVYSIYIKLPGLVSRFP